MKLSRVIVKHRKNCFMRGQGNPWSGLIDGHFWGNHAADEKVDHDKCHIWHRVVCNDPDCPAVKAVHSSILATA